MTDLDGYDWAAAGYPGNMLKGDPEVVAHTAREFSNTATHLSLAARSLRSLSDTSETCSEAVTKIVAKADTVAGMLEAVYVRYADASGALSSFAPVLARAQDQAAQALRTTGQARHDHDIAHNNAVLAYSHAAATIDPQQRHELLQHYYAQKARADTASSTLENAKAVIAAAIAERDAAASRATAQIADAIDQHDLNDTLTDHLKEVWHDVESLAEWAYEHDPLLKTLVDGVAAVARFVWDHIEEIALVLTIASMLLGWVPFVGPVLIALATVANFAARIISSAKLAIALVHGFRTGDWHDALWQGGALVVSLAAGAALKSVARGTSRQAWFQLRDASVQRTGSLRQAAESYQSEPERNLLQKAIHHYAPESPLGPMTAMGKTNDALISSLTGTPLAPKVQEGVWLSDVIDNKVTHQAMHYVIDDSFLVARGVVTTPETSGSGVGTQ